MYAERGFNARRIATNVAKLAVGKEVARSDDQTAKPPTKE
jgi:hypothetical protein